MGRKKIVIYLVSVKGVATTENAQPFSAQSFGVQPFGAQPTTLSFGNSTGSEKPATSLGPGLFSNLGNTPLVANSSQPSTLFGSNTPIPFGSNSSNAISIQKKPEPPKPDKPSLIFDANVKKSVTITKTADKENAHKIEVPKPVLGGIIQDKVDTVQKPTAMQPIFSNFGIPPSTTVVAVSPALSFGSNTTKDSSTAFNTIASSQANEVKSSFSVASITGPTKPNTTISAPVSTIASSTSSGENDFSFSLDKMGITPKSKVSRWMIIS